MQGVQFISILIIIAATVFTCADSHSGLSRLCRKGGCTEPCEETCAYGVVWNEHCGFYECGMGPGRWCREHNDNCGDGMRCICGTCHGCSTKQIGEKCHSSNDCIPVSSRSLQQPNYERYDWITANNVREI